MSDTNMQTATDLAADLGISPQTLKTWEKEFAPFLSAPGVSANGARHFTGEDATILRQVKDCVSAGLTLQETADELRRAGYGDEHPTGALTVTAAQQSFAVLTDALRAMIENQQAIQNSLQVNRNLLGVIIQDNFNLKEENARLRERMLRLEQELAEQKKRDSDYRLYLEQRITRMDAALRAATQKSFWQRLFGG